MNTIRLFLFKTWLFYQKNRIKFEYAHHAITIHRTMCRLDSKANTVTSYPLKTVCMTSLCWLCYHIGTQVRHMAPCLIFTWWGYQFLCHFMRNTTMVWINPVEMCNCAFINIIIMQIFINIDRFYKRVLRIDFPCCAKQQGRSQAGMNQKCIYYPDCIVYRLYVLLLQFKGYSLRPGT